LITEIPIQPRERTIIVDVLRGFALFGVLLGNFSGMLSNNVPESIINAHATSFDRLFNLLHDIFIQNKFMTLFSILFGYGFGVIMERLEKKNINSTRFFLRRMLWLFVFGCVNLALWNGDILHVYAMTGIFLLLFRKQSTTFILRSSIFFIFIIPSAIRFYQFYFNSYSVNESDVLQGYYQAYKFGSLTDVTLINYKSYPSQWIYTWVEWRDMSETLGRFLLGYYVLRRQLLVNLSNNILLIRTAWKWSLIISIFYIPLQALVNNDLISVPRPFVYPLLKFGTLSMTIFYATSIIQFFYVGRATVLFQRFRNLGCMTLTNYLVQTILYVIIFYHLGFGLLGEFSFSIVWLASIIVYFLQAEFSGWWLKRFNYGPVEWIWRQLTYRKRFKLIKERPLQTIEATN